MPRRPAKAQVTAAITALDSVRRTWLRRPEVSAVDVGFKISDNEITDDLAVRVHVERKKPIEALESYEVFNVAGETPQTVGDFPIDVIEASYAPDQVDALVLEESAVDRKSVVTPLIAGISCGNPRITAGTLGAVVYDRLDGAPQILSNWHVLAGSRVAAAGEQIWQPGKVDGGNSSRTVAMLNRFRLDRNMDAAIAKLTDARPFTRDIIGLPPIPGIDEPALGMNVSKSGRTTDKTEGIIDGLSHSVKINYRGSTGVVALHDQIHIVPRPPWPAIDYELSLGGDSGSVWVNDTTGRAVGLHFAGETEDAPTAENAIANRMTKVAAATGLNFSFTPLFCPPSSEPPPIPRDTLRQLICRFFPILCIAPAAVPQGRLINQAPAGATYPQESSAMSGDPAIAPVGHGREYLELIIDAIYEEMGWS